MRLKKTVCLAWLVLVLPSAAALLATTGLEPFQRIVVLAEGRKKPLDTFARNLLKQFSGRVSLDGRTASAWLAGVFFTPEQTLDDKVFLVNQPDVLAAIGLNELERGRYSFSELRPGFEKLHRLAFQYADQNESGLGRVESEAIRLFSNISTYYALLNAFYFARANEGVVPDLRGSSPQPAIIPQCGDSEKWFSPGRVLAQKTPLAAEIQREITILTRASRAYAAGQAADGSVALTAFNRSVENRLGFQAVRSSKLSLEILYNRIEPFFKAELAYGLALLVLLFSLAIRRLWPERLSVFFLVLGFLPHTFGMVARMLITNRPPVTNLYETFIFVAWAGVAIGLLMVCWQKNALGILAGGLTGLAFLVIAGRYGLEGDTMGMLAAVLDSNLWLATHVVTISLGYAGCIVAGIIGHAVIIRELWTPRSEAALSASRTLYAVLAFGLVLTSSGTLMGGIWADQSWGRFWGWDPKENGALLIIIWCAILFHARLAGWIGHIGMAAGSIGAIIAVVLAWFGVNLLGVGLHAYGFTSGAARGLLAFVAGEFLFLAVAVPLVKKKSRPKAAPTGN